LYGLVHFLAFIDVDTESWADGVKYREFRHIIR